MHSLQSLSQIKSAEEFSFAFRNFLDSFYALPDATLLLEAPSGTERNRNAYLAATCDFLCNRYALLKPMWLTLPDEDETFVSSPPTFAADYWKTRLWLLVDSPQEFRQRNIFIGSDALSRA